MKEMIRRFPRVAPCLLAIIVDYAGFGLVYPIIAALFKTNGGLFGHVGAHNFFQGLAYLLYPLLMFFGASILGDLSDKYGRKRILLLALIGIVLSYALMGFSVMWPSLTLFLISRGLSGLFAGCQPLAQAVVADVSSHEEKKWNMGLVALANNLGIIVGPLIAGIFTLSFFVNRGGYFYPFFFVGVFALVTLLWLQFSFRETFEARPEKKIGFWRPVEVFIDAFKDSLLRPLVIILFLFQFSVALLYQMLSIYLARTFDFTSSELGFFYGYLGLSMIFSILVVYPFLLRFMSLVTVIAIGLFGQGIMMFFLGAIPHLFSVFVFTALFAFTNVLAWTGYLSYYSTHVSKDQQGWAMGVFTASVALGFVAAGFMTNLLPWINLRAQLALAGVISALSGALYLLFHQARGKFLEKS